MWTSADVEGTSGSNNDGENSGCTVADAPSIKTLPCWREGRSGFWVAQSRGMVGLDDIKAGGSTWSGVHVPKPVPGAPSPSAQPRFPWRTRWRTARCVSLLPAWRSLPPSSGRWHPAGKRWTPAPTSSPVRCHFIFHFLVWTRFADSVALQWFAVVSRSATSMTKIFSMRQLYKTAA